MQIIDCIQGSDDWHKLREKRLTASHATAIGNQKKGLTTYVNKLMMEYYSTGDPLRYKNFHMSRGNNYEDLASFVYGVQTGIKTEKIGFVIHNGYVGCSPDLFCGEEGMGEIKARDDKAYWALLNGGLIDSGERWQTQMNMLICQKEWCDCIDFNPNFKKDLIVTRVYPDAGKIEDLEEGFKIGQELIEELTNKWESILK